MGGRITTPAVAAALNDVLTEHDIVVEEITTTHEQLRTVLRRTVPGTYFRSGGSGLGYGLGAALGIKLAAPDRRVVSLIGDGAFLFATPTPALWAMHLARTPALVVVFQNGGFAASRAPVFTLFPDGASARAGQVLGTLFADGEQDGPDLVRLAEASNAFGAHVFRPDELGPTLKLALERVDGGQVAVVVVHVASRWI
jgi:acetolactate synthase I/II/III large subunit